MNALESSFPAPALPAAAPGALFRAVIVDADPAARLELGEQLSFHTDFEVAASCANLADAAGPIAALAPELVILDWATLLDPHFWRVASARPCALIITATEPHHAVKAFELGALDYLLKPIVPVRFGAALGRARAVLRAARLSAALPPGPPPARPRAERLVLKRDGEFHFVAPHDIVRLEAQGDYVKVFTRTGTHLVRSTLARLGAQLDPGLFLRVHRSHVINRDHVTKATLRPEGDYSLTLGTSGAVPVARGQTVLIRQLLD